MDLFLGCLIICHMTIQKHLLNLLLLYFKQERHCLWLSEGIVKLHVYFTFPHQMSFFVPLLYCSLNNMFIFLAVYTYLCIIFNTIDMYIMYITSVVFSVNISQICWYWSLGSGDSTKFLSMKQSNKIKLQRKYWGSCDIFLNI